MNEYRTEIMIEEAAAYWEAFAAWAEAQAGE